MELYFGWISFIIGICIGSFLNVLIDRLPEDENPLAGRSHCDHCHRTLSWYELVPLLSFIIQKGKSRCCHRKLSLQYPLIEILTGILFVIIFYQIHFDYSIYSLPAQAGFIGLLVDWIIGSILLVIFVTDLKTQIIPDSMIIAGIIFAIIRLFVSNNYEPIINNNFLFILHNSYFIIQYLISAIGAAAFFLTIWLITHGRGMGFGDVKLALIIGLLTGFPGTVIALYVAFLTGAILGVILILSGNKKLKSKIAFGPFMIFGVICTLLWQTQIMSIVHKFI
jgi:leader peptidase (prepilin peptidase) / N-methyltransferase